MPNCRRNPIAGGCYFFTVNLRDRNRSLLVEPVDLLRARVRRVQALRPFHIDAWVQDGAVPNATAPYRFLPRSKRQTMKVLVTGFGAVRNVLPTEYFSGIYNTMNTSSSSIPALPGAPEMARRFGVILVAMMGVVARRFVREPRLVLLNVPLWSWLNRAIRRFAGALARPVIVGPSRAGRIAAVRAPRVRLLGARGWLLRELGWEIAVYRSQLEALLAEPDMRAALEARPGAGRILRPLCRMLGVEVPGLALPVAVTAEVSERRKAKRLAALVPTWPRKGLPQVPKGGWFAPPIKNWG